MLPVRGGQTCISSGRILIDSRTPGVRAEGLSGDVPPKSHETAPLGPVRLPRDVPVATYASDLSWGLRFTDRADWVGPTRMPTIRMKRRMASVEAERKTPENGGMR